MRVLLIGSGGREHAIAWKLLQSSSLTKLYVAPGNGGISQVAQCVSIPHADLLPWAKSEKIDFLVVGPEQSLAAGIVDKFEETHIPSFGVKRQAAQLEASKVYAKKLMERYGLPTARFEVVSRITEGEAALDRFSLPVVIKADGLCGGKGSFICEERSDALHVLSDLLIKKIFGPAGEKVIIEEFLPGYEISYMGFAAGETFVPLATSQDYKRLGDGHTGPNTGGMGAISPNPLVDDLLEEKIKRQVVEPFLELAHGEKLDYRGVIYMGLMLYQGTPYVLEFNVRFGDPETQVILPRYQGDLLSVFVATQEKKLAGAKLQWKEEKAVTVVLASKGYPGDYEEGFEIIGLNEKENENVHLFHAGTVLENGKWKTKRGRILGVSALGKSWGEARNAAYGHVKKIGWKGMTYRKDIGDN